MIYHENITTREEYIQYLRDNYSGNTENLYELVANLIEENNLLNSKIKTQTDIIKNMTEVVDMFKTELTNAKDENVSLLSRSLSTGSVKPV